MARLSQPTLSYKADKVCSARLCSAGLDAAVAAADGPRQPHQRGKAAAYADVRLRRLVREHPHAAAVEFDDEGPGRRIDGQCDAAPGQRCAFV